MTDERGALDIDDLLRIILVLVIVWLAIEILTEFLGFLFGPLSSVIGLVLLVVLVLWYLDVV